MKTKIAYQGTEGSFSETAIGHLEGIDAESIGKMTFEEVLESLIKEEVHLSLLPIENSLIGPIAENLDLMAHYDVAIIAEVLLPIKHCLVGQKGLKLENISKVISHPKALAQCTKFFQAHPWITPEVHYDTAGAAKEIALKKQETVAAIGCCRTAELYGLEILKEDLADEKSNTTRFVLLQKGKPNLAEKKGGKGSLLLTLKHEAGTLACCLNILTEHKMNLMQIVSRPIRDRPFEYLFFIDLVVPKEGKIGAMLHALKERTQTLKLLGFYEMAK